MINPDELLPFSQIRKYSDLLGVVPGTDDDGIISQLNFVKDRHEKKNESVPQTIIEAKDALLKNNQLMRNLRIPFSVSNKHPYIKDIIEFNYDSAKKVILDDFPYNGSDTDYSLHSNPENEFTLYCADIIESLISKTKNNRQLLALDLGAGYGNIPLALMDKFSNRVLVKGITSGIMRNTWQNCLGNNLIVGNLESLSEIPQIQDQQFDFIFSNHTFTYIGNPLNTICDAYEMLAPDGVLFFNHVYIHGINTKTGLSLMSFLRNQNYDITMGISESTQHHTRNNCCGPIWICIKKNQNIKLNLPFYYGGYSANALQYSDFNHCSYHLMIEYIPQQQLLDFINTHQQIIELEVKINGFEQLRKQSILPDDHIYILFEKLKSDICQLFDQYISFWKLSIFGHHHNQRAINIKNAIQASKSVLTIIDILDVQTNCLNIQDSKIGTLINLTQIDLRWLCTDQMINRPLVVNTSGYYRAIQDSKKLIAQFQEKIKEKSNGYKQLSDNTSSPSPRKS